MLIRLNERFRSLFLEYINRHNTTPSYGYGGYTPNYSIVPSQSSFNKPTTHTIYFYEWSNVNGTSIVFNSIETFKKFCSEHGIRFQDHHEMAIKDNYYVYGTCIPGTPTLMIRNHYKDLKDSLEVYRQNMVNVPH